MNRILKEILNTTLHILLGGILCFAFLPKAELWVLVLICGGLGAVREHIQGLRKHQQPPWIKYLDAAGFIVGALLYGLARHYGLNAE